MDCFCLAIKMKYCWVFLWGVLLVGCHSQKGTIAPATKISLATLTPGEPHLLLLTGTISYDSLKATYQLDFTSEKCVDGYVNIDNANPDSTGLHYVQIGDNQAVLSKQAIENPLRRDVEYLGQTGYEHKVTILPKADIFLRIQLNKEVQEIEFRNGQQMIKRITINN